MKSLLLAVFFVVFCSCKNPKENIYTQLKGNVFGTTYGIRYSDNKDYEKQLDSLFTKINTSLSTYMPTSDISKINKGDTTVVVDDLFIEVFNKAKRIYKETDGYFDPTIGKLIDAYGFGSGKVNTTLTNEEIQKLIQNVGFDKVIIKNRKVYKKKSNIEFNVNALAKGYGLDVVARFFDSKNIKNYLIEIGGEIRAKGVSFKKKPWKIQLENPLKSDTREAFRYLYLSNKSMATSGNYRKFRVTEDGKKYVHTINPKTGFATASNLLSASVIAETDCADVDAYATAFMAMGLERTKTFIKKYPDLKVILIYENEKGKLSQYSNYTH